MLYEVLLTMKFLYSYKRSDFTPKCVFAHLKQHTSYHLHLSQNLGQ